MDIKDILKKPGKEWTPEERKIVNAELKDKGRQTLKEIRKQVYEKSN